MSAGKGYIDVSTIDPATAAAVAAAVRGTGALYLEAPVSGSKGPAEQGALIFLTAGKFTLGTSIHNYNGKLVGKMNEAPDAESVAVEA